MKYHSSIIFSLSILIYSCSNSQPKNNLSNKPQNESDNSPFYSKKLANPKAQALMSEDFYWSSIEETAPFGSDAGSDAANGFRQWRIYNKNVSPTKYYQDLMESWQLPLFDYKEMDTEKIKQFILSQANPDESKIQQRIALMKQAANYSSDTSISKLDDKQMRNLVLQSSKTLGSDYLANQDNAIIAIGFAQFVLEGNVDDDIQSMTVTAINRELLPIMMNLYEQRYRERRESQLKKMLIVITRATSQ